ncbi:hypothetical protein IscW_ISCW017501 [Ixodes scapularis]|uniref:Uncharacterized protein n=1 Tax=Ixodes scapularis TaxID=6945 RepID=B7PBL5_IXOSC|nr:hypothetical protein IscW_ISCW017501 [Ixodes scapularis]|eukprot:XP_002408540.1 hypothetical protein IscW_ISCW017501 [Ixodes scapularis]
MAMGILNVALQEEKRSRAGLEPLELKALKRRTRQEGPRLENVDVFATKLEEESRKVELTVQTHKGVQTQEARRWHSGQEEATLLDQQRLQASTEYLPSDIPFQEEPDSGQLRTVRPREDFGGRAKLCSTAS